MVQWWYVDEGIRKGPVCADRMAAMLGEGAVGARTLVWREGMTEWLAIADMPDWSEVSARIPPAVPEAADAERLAGPWRRYVARVLDLVWEVLLVGAFYGALLGGAYPGFAAWLRQPGSGLVYGVACLPVALMFDSLVHAVFPNTPFKALLRIRLADDRRAGAKPRLGRHFARNMKVWVFGLGFGLPFITLIAQLVQWWYAKKHHKATYDGCIRVTARPLGWFRLVVVALALMLGAVIVATGLVAIARP